MRVKTHPRISWRKRILFGGITFLLCLTFLTLACELMLRMFAPQLLVPRYVTDSGFGIRVHCPNISIYHTTPDYRVNIRTNSMGIRADREFAFDKSEGVFRVILLGDSFTFGYGVEIDHTYGAVLDRILAEEGIKAEVINLGVSGAGTAEELIMLNNVGLKFDPDMVIVGYCWNDVTNDIWSKLYTVGDQGQLIRDQDSYLPAMNVRDFLYSFGIYRFLAERSHLVCFLRDKVSVAVQKSVKKKIQESAAPSHESRQGQLTAALLDEIKRTSENNDASFCVLDIPSRRNVSGLPRAFLTLVKEDDIIDLRPVFEREKVTKKLYWTKSANHWTPAGHAIAAELLAGWIKTQIKTRTMPRDAQSKDSIGLPYEI